MAFPLPISLLEYEVLGGEFRVLPAVCWWRKGRELVMGTLSNAVYV